MVGVSLFISISWFICICNEAQYIASSCRYLQRLIPFLCDCIFEGKDGCPVDKRLVLNFDQVWRCAYRPNKRVWRKVPRKHGLSAAAKAAARASNTNHTNVGRSRKSITVITSSWSDGSSGPLGFCLPTSLLPHKVVETFNKNHKGISYAFPSGTKSHFMTVRPLRHVSLCAMLANTRLICMFFSEACFLLRNVLCLTFMKPRESLF